jgi:hypothetical protein
MYPSERDERGARTHRIGPWYALAIAALHDAGQMRAFVNVRHAVRLAHEVLPRLLVAALGGPAAYGVEV